MIKLVGATEKAVIYVCVFLSALFVVPSFPASFTLPRGILLAASVGLLFILWSVKLVAKGSMTFAKGKYDWPVFLILLVYLTSAVFVAPNKMEAFWLPGTAVFVIASAFFYFFINQLEKEEKRGVATALFFSGVAFSLQILFSALGIFAKISGLPEFLKAEAFNTLGGGIPAAVFLACLLPLAADFIVKDRDLVKRIFFSVSAVVIVFGLLVSVKNIIPAKGETIGLLDYSTSWQIMVDALKFNPVLGVGPANYLTAFNRFKPITFNSSPFWTGSFTSSRSFYMTAVTEVGLAAAVVLFFLLLTVNKEAVKKGYKEPKNWPLFLFLVLSFAFPVAGFGITLLFILLAIASGSSEKTYNINFLAQGESPTSSFSSRIPSLIVTLPIIALALAAFYFGGRYGLAEYRFQEAINAVNANQAKTAIDKMVAAINLNPRVDRYRLSYSQINMAIAQNLAAKKDLTDDDKNAISQLIQTAIAEAKNAVALNPTRANAWASLADIYRAVMSFAEGADEFAIQTYAQAVALDPVNPNLRIALGGIYYALGRYDDAIDSFKLAVLAKPDLANSRFNLAVAYRDKKEYAKALAEMKAVLSLVDEASPDYKTVQDEIAKLEPFVKETEKETAAKAGTLTPPQKAPEPVIEPPLELPEEATPPATE